jgi:hypothetical protein
MSQIKKHSKFKNSGILFELLVRQVTSDAMSNKDSQAVKILKKYFFETEIAKEYTLYNSLLTSPKLNESKSEILLNSVLTEAKKLNLEKLAKEKYNLIREIKKYYDFDNFFKAKIANYQVFASISTLFEAATSKEIIDPRQIVVNKITLHEHITQVKLDAKKAERKVVEEFMKEDKDVRILAYNILVEKYNQLYSDLSDDQKGILKEYINSVSETVELKKYINNKFVEVKTTLTELSNKVEDKVIKIKLNEVLSLIKPIGERETIKEDHLVTLLQHYELVKEIKAVI